MDIGMTLAIAAIAISGLSLFVTITIDAWRNRKDER